MVFKHEPNIILVIDIDVSSKPYMGHCQCHLVLTVELVDIAVLSLYIILCHWKSDLII